MNRTENSDVRFAFLLASAECYSRDEGISSFCASLLFGLGSLLGSSLYYKKSVEKAKEYLNILSSFRSLSSNEQICQTDIEGMLKAAESRIAEGSPMVKLEPKVCEAKKNQDPKKIEVKGLSSYWMGLNVEMKRDFMKVSTAEFTSFVERLYGTEGRDALMQALDSAREDKKNGDSGCVDLPSLTKDMAQKISKVWARKISDGSWEPVDAVAAVEMIKNQLEDVKAFAYVNRWSKDWPLAADEDRSKLLKEIRSLLVSFWDRKILSCSVREWVMDFVILDFLKKIKCERDDGADVVRRAVDSIYIGIQVKEKIDFDIEFSFLMLDKRLLGGKIDRFDDDGTISFVEPNDHYAKAHVHGDGILSWLADHTSGDESFRFPRPIRGHNLCIWMAILRAVQFSCRALEDKSAMKSQLLDYGGALSDIKKLCISEDENRRNLQEDQWNNYASILCDRCEERDTAKVFLCAVRDVLKGELHPTFDFADLEDCLNAIRGCKNLSDDVVLKSIDLLKLAVTKKVPIIDSKILLIEYLRINLLNDFIRLSVFYHRSNIIRPLKEFLLEGAVEADLLLGDEKKPESKKKKHRSKKKTSKSMPSPKDKTVEDMQNLPGEDSVLREGATRCDSALTVTLKALLNIKVLKEDLVHNVQPFHDELEKQIHERLYSFVLSDLLTSIDDCSVSSNAAKVGVSILESWHCWKSLKKEGLVTRLFTLEEYERMSCSKCKKKSNYPEKSCYNVVMAADSIRDLNCAFGDVEFVDLLKMIRMEDKMLCDIKTGGCGKENFVHHVINRCPPIFTIMLEWEKNEGEEEIFETTKALDCEIDISRLYEGLEPRTMYRLVSMVCCGEEEEEHIFLAYKKDRWISLRHEALGEEDVGDWESVVSFCGEKQLRLLVRYLRRALQCISVKINEIRHLQDMQNMPGEDSLSKHESPQGEAVTGYNSALNMTLKALLNINVLKDDFVSAFVSENIKEDGLYSYLLRNLLASPEDVDSMSSDATEVVVSILESWHCWKSPEGESLVTRLFTLEEYERMTCSKCRKQPNYPEQNSYGVVMAADSLRDLKCAFGDINFVDILKIIRMEHKILCDIKTGGCGKENFIHHVISKCPPIFTITLVWEKDETEEQISETIKALDCEIDISMLYEGLDPNTILRMWKMQVCCGEEEEHIGLAYKKNRWTCLRHEVVAEEDVGDWKSVVSFCGAKNVRPEILFYEVAMPMA
ncbi:unnamed protein product [Thlaspi arvense]|uniref:Uncharacterized protein n=1 Tax=Thlaspi arvense TaxID=13288 RepID=A0AAU9SLJ6_THLAR|nr:unnamed protein product [Thlaspi arvense]